MCIPEFPRVEGPGEVSMFDSKLFIHSMAFDTGWIARKFSVYRGARVPGLWGK